MDTDPLGSKLSSVVGTTHVITDPQLTSSCATDFTRRFTGRARLVVRPGNTAEVAEAVSVCAGEGVPIVPQGGNTGLVGGGVPRGGEVVLSLRRLTSLGPADTAAMQVTVGAGVPLAELQRRVRAQGLDFGVDFAARDSATIGGMIATNAGGGRVLRHGTTRANVAGLEAVLPDGGVIERLAGLPKDNTGSDRHRLSAYREGHTEAINAAGIPLKLDVAMPLPGLAAFVADLEELLAGMATPYLFGHLAEGNIHVNLLGAGDRAEEITEAVLRRVAAAGGSVSAEHGVGRAKTRWLGLSRSPAEIAAMRAIKQALDPHGLLNPGVLFHDL